MVHPGRHIQASGSLEVGGNIHLFEQRQFGAEIILIFGRSNQIGQRGVEIAVGGEEP